MQTNDTLKAVADTVTEDPVSFTIDILPRNRWHQWAQNNKHLNRYFPQKKEYSIRPITYGNLHRISRLVMSVDLTGMERRSMNDVGMELLSKHAGMVAEIVAIAITNSRQQPPKSLINELLYSLTASESMTLLMLVLKQMEIQNFLATIIYCRGANVLSDGKKPDEKS